MKTIVAVRSTQLYEFKSAAKAREFIGCLTAEYPDVECIIQLPQTKKRKKPNETSKTKKLRRKTETR